MNDVTEASLPKAIFLMGPTASGKTALAIALRKVLPVELISVDSALIYRGMDIGTAKPDAAELKVPLTEVQEDLKKLWDIRYWVRKATPGTEESKEPPKKQPIKEVLQDKADEKKAQRTAPAQAKHRQQDMEL